MADDDRMARQRRQVAMLFAYSGIGTLSDGAVAKNLGMSPQEIRPALSRDRLRAGRGCWNAERNSGRERCQD